MFLFQWQDVHHCCELLSLMSATCRCTDVDGCCQELAAGLSCAGFCPSLQGCSQKSRQVARMYGCPGDKCSADRRNTGKSHENSKRVSGSAAGLQYKSDMMQEQVKCLVPACVAYIDVPLAILLRARGIHLLSCVGAGACWEQHARGRPSSRVITPRPTPPASFKHSFM